MFDFANILFAGPCNRSCPWCIGKQMPDQVNVNNLDVFPPRGIEAFIEAVNRERVAQIVFTGTVTDPQLYRHEARLLTLLRDRLHPQARFSVHTNGVLARRKMKIFNSYDRACISFPSFVPDTYGKLMGSRRVPDLAAILENARIPVKVSAVVNEHNVHELEAFVAQCHRIGVKRLVIRHLFGDRRRWPMPVLRERPVVRTFKGNPVVDYQGMEVTIWDFDETTGMSSLNLFADGTLGTDYLITRTRELLPRRPAQLPASS